MARGPGDKGSNFEDWLNSPSFESDTDGQDAAWNLLNALWDGEATPAENEKASALLADPSHAREFAFLEEIGKTVSALDEIEPPESLRDAILMRTTRRRSLASVVLGCLSDAYAVFAAPGWRLAAGGAIAVAAVAVAVAYQHSSVATTPSASGLADKASPVKSLTPHISMPATVASTEPEPAAIAEARPHPLQHLAVGRTARASSENERLTRAVARLNDDLRTNSRSGGAFADRHVVDRGTAFGHGARTYHPVRSILGSSSARGGAESVSSGYSIVAASEDNSRHLHEVMAEAEAHTAALESDVQPPDNPAPQAEVAARVEPSVRIREAPPLSKQSPPDSKQYVTTQDIRRTLAAKRQGYDVQTFENIKSKQATIFVWGGRF